MGCGEHRGAPSNHVVSIPNVASSSSSITVLDVSTPFRLNGQTFAKTIDHPSIPSSFMILTESSDSTDYIMGAQTGLFDCLKDEKVGGLLKSLIVSVGAAARDGEKGDGTVDD